MSLEKIGVLLFDKVELLDFAGPIQVFSSFQYLYPSDSQKLVTIGLSREICVSKLGMKVIPDHVIDEFDEDLDLLVIPGGMGTRPIIKDDDTLAKIDQLINRSVYLSSVCTGSLVAARLGRLSHLRATTHYAAAELLLELDNTILLDRSKRYHDHDHVIVSEGVSAGIDMSFYLLTKHYGAEKSEEVRKYIEYFPDSEFTKKI